MAAFPVGDFEILETVIETRIETGVTETVTETGTKCNTKTSTETLWTEPKYKINVYWSELRYQSLPPVTARAVTQASVASVDPVLRLP